MRKLRPDFECVVPLEKKDYGPLQEEKSGGHCVSELVDGRLELAAAARNPLKSLRFQRIFVVLNQRSSGRQRKDQRTIFPFFLMI